MLFGFPTAKNVIPCRGRFQDYLLKSKMWLSLCYEFSVDGLQILILHATDDKTNTTGRNFSDIHPYYLSTNDNIVRLIPVKSLVEF